MKKLLLIALSVLTLVRGNAQITINKSDIAVAGEWFLMGSDTSPSATAAGQLRSGGNNVTWDISGWIHGHLQDTTWYANGSTYPGAPSNCNLVNYTKDAIGGESPTFMNISNSALRVIVDEGLPVTGEITLLTFPSTLGTIFKDSMKSVYTDLATNMGMPANPLFDSVKIFIDIQINSLIDGYGKLKNLAGQFDVIRQKTVQTFGINVKLRNVFTGTYTDLPGGVGLNTNESTTSYTWYGSNMGHILMQANEDTAGNIVQVDFMLASSRGVRSGLNKEHRQLAVNTGTRAYPNPATDVLTIETQVNKGVNVQLRVFDILGNEVMPESTVAFRAGTNELPVEVNRLKPGMYFYTLTGSGVNVSSKFVVK